ncbi:MAG: hypothetical protein M5U27_03890 [Gaiella sp.]|nr:hypothetical protein [Gaiella sp.]
MSVQPVETLGLAAPGSVDALDAHELDALTSAAAWYFKYHGRMIAERADDRSAAALAQRDDFLDLHAALGKLGVRLALPSGLKPRD